LTIIPNPNAKYNKKDFNEYYIDLENLKRVREEGIEKDELQSEESEEIDFNEEIKKIENKILMLES
jgi:hypothetical protein